MPIDTEPTEVTTVQKSPNTTSNTVKAYAFTPEFVTVLRNYLSSKPFAEVANLMEALSKSPEIDLTITQNAPESN